MFAPFTATIEQTAEVSAPAAVVEHHSAFDLDEVANAEEEERLRQTALTWGAQVEVTATVRLVESVFRTGPRMGAKAPARGSGRSRPVLSHGPRLMPAGQTSQPRPA